MLLATLINVPIKQQLYVANCFLYFAGYYYVLLLLKHSYLVKIFEPDAHQPVASMCLVY